MRQSGILLPVTSLPSPYGIGTMGKAAYNWIDFLENAKQSYWQVLPLGPTSFKDSPYQTFSAFAGNPYLIDLDMLVEEGLLEENDLSEYMTSELTIDYGLLYSWRFKILKKAYERFDENDEDFKAFNKNESYWLNDYALFMAIKNYFQGRSWQEWPNEFKLRKKVAIDKFIKGNEVEIKFYKFIQFIFAKQWHKLKAYANEKKVEIIGDVPIYVALDSVDVWSNPEEYQLDNDLKPKRVAGCPPDDFAKKGQLWGNPLYDYHKMEKNNFKWWNARIKKSFELYDVVRIDHFRGFESYYSIDALEETAENGKWVKGPGMKLFKSIKDSKDLHIIAEDLGFLTPAVHKLLKQTGFPGMKILQFGFDKDGDSPYAPHNYLPNCIVYTGTHDNPPIRTWFETLDKETKHMVSEYVNLTSDDKICDRMVRLALSSVANIAIIPIQDYLGLGIESRINTPSTSENNWQWRLDEKYITKELADYILFLTRLYRRTNFKIEV